MGCFAGTPCGSEWPRGLVTTAVRLWHCSLRAPRATGLSAVVLASADRACLETLPPSCAGLEAQFMAEVAKERWPVLIAIFYFDIVT